MTAPKVTTGAAFNAIRARENASTAGPWVASHRIVSGASGEGKGWAEVEIAAPTVSVAWGGPGGDELGALADAEFIAHAREDIPALLAAVDDARRIAASLEADLARILDAWDAHQTLMVEKPRPSWQDDWALTAAIAAARAWVGTEAGYMYGHGPVAEALAEADAAREWVGTDTGPTT